MAFFSVKAQYILDKKEKKVKKERDKKHRYRGEKGREQEKR